MRVLGILYEVPIGLEEAHGDVLAYFAVEKMRLRIYASGSLRFLLGR